MEIREALDVKHVHLIHKQYTRYELGNALVYVAVHHLVDFSTKLICSEKNDSGWLVTDGLSCSDQGSSQFLYQ